ncbi:hypothetical protein ANCCAN_17752 [Ancylostoma caninum]|uniref:Uncharacterized protein n=1 Tax=Ancylostoma caninum TaxID=29170 RepID=A0A368G023_ANCCA|nr:hypothetical protein ANCCAN_17752 [Ancylostoma caninum]
MVKEKKEFNRFVLLRGSSLKSGRTAETSLPQTFKFYLSEDTLLWTFHNSYIYNRITSFEDELVQRRQRFCRHAAQEKHSRVDMYGRGVSTECESPTLPRKPLGGPQPTQEQSPFLFDKAKKIIMQYPGRPDLSEIEDGMIKKKKDWLKTQDPDQQGGSDASVTPTPR